MCYLSNLQKIPNTVLVGIMMEAQKKAMSKVENYTQTWTSIDFFWSLYNVEFRQLVERWMMQNANVKT